MGNKKEEFGRHANKKIVKSTVPTAQQHLPRHVQNGKRSEIRMLLARQNRGKELPTFCGNLNEWLAFVSQFRRSTAVCGFSDDET